ncbi:MAG: MaoC family dehydratase [Acidimicrobiales bacterium]
MAQTFNGSSTLLAAVGADLGTTEWLIIDQDRIDAFADATLDHQWIHVDPVAAADGPFGSTIAHGYLTMSLVNHFLPQLIDVQGVSMGINYGANKIRFPSPVHVGKRIRGTAKITEATPVKDGVQVVITVTVEIEGGDKPAAVVETVSRFID